MDHKLTQTIVLGGGCFWCLEAVYQLVHGVKDVKPGYAGGNLTNPSYSEVSKGLSGHAEVVKVDFEPDIVSLKDLLDIFWVIHDPTTPNRQGNDVGPQYRSIILYTNNQQEAIIQSALKQAATIWPDKVVTQVKKLQKFYEAEAEHHNYFLNHPEQAYCQVIINPKLAKLKSKFAALLK